MKKLVSVLFFSLSLTGIFAQAGTKMMLDLESDFAKQNVPIYEGVEEFQEKLNKIRQEQGREPMGLVLCGGSARAFAHIGALKAMEENEITPDFIVANSMGAIIGMLYAYGFSPDKILEVVLNIPLTSYFEPVVPIHGGVLSVRKFRGLVNNLLGKDKTDLSECPIPILILTEDLYTKRQIYHASGDFARIMTAAFAMSAIMEPTKYTLQDEEKRDVFLIDSGAIDIAGLTVAEQFSTNIVISTAFYDAVLNYNNPIVVLNRTMSIGKERAAARDIKQFMPVVIRNDVEHFSFMAFDKSQELSDIGYSSALSVMEEIKNCPHGYVDLSNRRKETDTFADKTIDVVLNNERVKLDENYFGLKIWPVFPVVDFPDYTLYNRYGLTTYMFGETSNLYGRAGISMPFTFDGISGDALFRFSPASFISTELFASYIFDQYVPSDFYGAATIKIRPNFFPKSLKSILFTGEYSSNKDFTPKEVLFKGGLHFDLEDRKNNFLMFKPFYYMAGQSYSELSNGAGYYLQASINTSIFSKKAPGFAAGITNNNSGRYSFFAFGDGNPETHLYNSDFFRGQKPDDKNQFIVSNSTEVFLEELDPGLTAAELFILQKYQVGSFFDYAWTGVSNYSVGGFLRAQVSLIGLCNFILEGGAGWNFNEQKVFGFFEMKNRF